MHLEGKTIRDISKEVHMSFRDISKIIKAYDKKIGLEQNKKENNQQPTTKKLSLSSKAFILFLISFIFVCVVFCFFFLFPLFSYYYCFCLY
jgi:hypothetical protein